MNTPPIHGATSASRTLSARALVIGCFALVAAGMMMLAGATLWSQASHAEYAARVDMAYAQALAVTRLERAAATLDPADAAARAALSRSAEAYLASIAAEARLLGDDASDQAAELARAQRLIDAIMAGGGASELAETRRLASAIAAAEVREADAAHRRAEAAAARTRTLVMAAAAAVLLVPLGLLIALERLLVAPLRRLEAASDELAQAQHPAEPLAPRGLHDADGRDLCREARAAGAELPICMLTARAELEDKLAGFACGADDYLTKPFAMDELLARLAMMVHRGAARPAARITRGALVIDPAGRSIVLGEERIVPSRREFDLLHCLARNPGRAVSRAQLLDEVWGEGADVTANTVDGYVGYVRRQLAR